MLAIDERLRLDGTPWESVGAETGTLSANRAGDAGGAGAGGQRAASAAACAPQPGRATGFRAG
jgi:hypothetical protein